MDASKCRTAQACPFSNNADSMQAEDSKMGETKPKWGARNIVKHCSIEESMINEIKRETKFDIDKDSTEDLKRACEWFMGRLKLYAPQNRVRMSNKVATLKKILFKRKNDGPLPELLKMLKCLDPDTKSFLKLDTELSDFSDPSYCYHFTIEKIVEELEILNRSVLEGYEKLKEMKDTGGRPFDIPLQAFLNEIWAIYKKCTGKNAKRAYNSETAECYGDFPVFASICMSALKLNKRYPLKTLHSAIQRYVKEASFLEDYKPDSDHMIKTSHKKA